MVPAMERPTLLLAALLALLLAGPAAAQDADFTKLMTDTNAAVPTPDAAALQAETLSLMKEAAPQEGWNCTPATVTLDEVKPATASRIVVDGVRGGKVRNGWTAYAKVAECPAADTTRLLILSMADGRLLVRMMGKGESIADVSLILDTLRAANLAAFRLFSAADASCKADDLKVASTRVESRGADLGPDFYGVRFKGGWRELWTYSACGRRAELPVEFTADGQGGAYYKLPGKDAHLLK